MIAAWTCLALLSTPPAPAEATAAPAPATPAAAVSAPAPAESLPDPHVEDPGLRVAKPGYDLGIDEVHVKKANGTQYRLTARQWNDLVREDPELWRLHTRGRLLVPGIVLGSVGGVWLTLSTALRIDGWRSDTATGALFQWGLPAAIAFTGVAMTIVGVSARRRLFEARRRMYVSPYANGRTAGVTLAGRF